MAHLDKMARLEPGTRLLAADDDPIALMMLKANLDSWGVEVIMVDNGVDALAKLTAEDPPRLALLDWEMPGMNGPAVCKELRSVSRDTYVYTILLTSRDGKQDLIDGLESGADDYIFKPFDPDELRVRLVAGDRIARLQEELQQKTRVIAQQNEENSKLLLNIMPAPIAERLKRGEERIIDRYSTAAVLFADLEGFTALAASMDANDLVDLLNQLFRLFDQAATAHGVEKIKTLGDGYMAACGLPAPCDNPVQQTVNMAHDMLAAVEKVNRQRQTVLAIRIGIHAGPVLAGVIGQNKYTYDLWGDTVNTASRMEKHGQAGGVHLSSEAYRLLSNPEGFVERTIEVKGKGTMTTHLWSEAKVCNTISTAL